MINSFHLPSLNTFPGASTMQAQPELWLSQTLPNLETSNHTWRKSLVSSSAWYHHLQGCYMSWQLLGLPGSPTPCKTCFKLQIHPSSLWYSPIFPMSAQSDQHSKEITSIGSYFAMMLCWRPFPDTMQIRSPPLPASSRQGKGEASCIADR